MAATHWDLAAEGQAYRDCLNRFGHIEQALNCGLQLSPEEALLLRLLLVHQFRQAALRDPGLPPEALPNGWPGGPARQLFARLYLALSAPAEVRIGETFEGEEGPLPSSSPGSDKRAQTLRASLAKQA